MSDLLPANSRIYVAGHRGLAGSALVRTLASQGYRHLITRSHSELDLTDQAATRRFFETEKPDVVLLAAAKVGGIVANAAQPATFIGENLAIQVNVIDAAYRNGVKRLLFLGSSCIYPKFAPQPMQEQYLLTGLLEPTNEAYAIAKIAGLKMCAAYNKQFGTDFMAVMPTNLFGPGDNYDLENSHVLPALIRKMHEAKAQRDGTVVVWGSGTPRREFLYSDDLADACVFLLRTQTAATLGEFVNVGTGVDVTVRELAQAVRKIVGFEGELVFDAARPDGTPRKVMDVSRLSVMGWQPKVAFEDGVARAYADFLTNLIEMPVENPFRVA